MGTTSKALSLLNFFNRARSEIGLSDMARLSGMNKATVHRLMTELAQHGFVEQIGSGREYRLGPAVLRLAALREHTVPMREIAQRVLDDLSQATGETAHMSVLSGQTLATTAYTYSHAHGTMVMMEDAEVLDLHATSSGLSVLAFSAPTFIDAVLSVPLNARTPQTMTDPDAIRAMLPAIRARGYAMSVGGFEEDVHSYAVPVFDAQMRAMGAVAVATPVSRMTEGLRARILDELMTRVPALTRLMGGFLPSTFPTFEPQQPLQKEG